MHLSLPPLLTLGFSLLISTSPALSRTLTYSCADFSSVPVVEAAEVTYTDSGKTGAFENILASHGVNLARIRVWTAGDYDLDVALATAKRAKAAGMGLLVDLHYSDTWADPGKQAIPSSWPTDLEGLNSQIYSYTKDLVTSFSDQDTPIDIIQIGNEINSGILWPVGEISENGYDGLSQLLHSGVSGVRDASDSVKTLIHLANGWDSGAVQSFYEGVFREGELTSDDVDLMGFSFYPFYGTGATFDALKASLEGVISKYGKDVLVVETDWAESCSGVTMSEPSIPISASGQETWVADVRDVLAGLSGAKGLGICYWEPGWVGNAALGSNCSDTLLVDESGATRTSIRMFSEDM